MGCSAGSIGAQIWSGTILNALKWKTAAVVPDSYAGVFPPGSQGPLIYGYGMCTVAPLFLSDDLVEKCWNQELTFQDMMEEIIVSAPRVPFSYVQSKEDDVQQSFYVAIGRTTGTAASITPSEFYYKVNEIFGLYNKESNFLSYLVDGPQHCFTPTDVFYSADAKGPHDDGQTNEDEMLYSWYLKTHNFISIPVVTSSSVFVLISL